MSDLTNRLTSLYDSLDVGNNYISFSAVKTLLRESITALKAKNQHIAELSSIIDRALDEDYISNEWLQQAYEDTGKEASGE